MIAIDWGTSSFRAYRLDARGKVVEQHSSAKGILAVNNGQFAEALQREIGDWIAAGDAPIMMSGMIGSRQGWAEAAYAECPAGFEEIASRMCEVRWGERRAWIAPGLTCRDGSGVQDVMRGEEMQIMGILDELQEGEQRICMPGTHSKWVTVKERRILRFSTYMTGEVFAVMRNHSILGRMMMEKDTETDGAAFDAGVARAGEPGGILHHLFGVRARSLFGELDEKQSMSYLSGILVGHEMHSAREDARHVHLLCTPQLATLYRRAAEIIGITTSTLDPNAVAHSLYRLSTFVSQDA
ncbi:MAG: 2-dehydro-3-deoxygalactonokinase [Burkholderiales bacterium]